MNSEKRKEARTPLQLKGLSSLRRNEFYHRNRKNIRFFSGNKHPEGEKHHYQVMLPYEG